MRPRLPNSEPSACKQRQFSNDFPTAILEPWANSRVMNGVSVRARCVDLLRWTLIAARRATADDTGRSFSCSFPCSFPTQTRPGCFVASLTPVPVIADPGSLHFNLDRANRRRRLQKKGGLPPLIEQNLPRSSHKPPGACKMSRFQYKPLAERIVARRLTFCDRLPEWPMNELIEEGLCCNMFLVHCCRCDSRYGSRTRPCHHFCLVFTDEACSNNGSQGAVAGIGAAFGSDEPSHWLIPVTDKIDPAAATRTSQCEELLAALEGVSAMIIMDNLDGHKRINDTGEKAWVIAADSEYVVKGMTEWPPSWKARYCYTTDPSVSRR